MIDLRLGRWQDALADVERVDAVICDPPYSERTHRGHDGATTQRHDGADARRIGYDAWTVYDVEEFCSWVAQRSHGWVCVMTDFCLAPTFAESLAEIGLYVFTPVPIVSPGSRVRLLGDGPSCWTVWLIVARPKHQPFSTWGTLPGAYIVPPERNMAVAGGKPLSLMRSLVRDYTRPGDLVCDPCAGGGTTLLAAAMEGRRAVGAEMDPDTYAKAKARLDAGYTPDMFSTMEPEPALKQALLLPKDEG